MQFFVFLSQTHFNSIYFAFDEVNIFDVKLIFPCFEDFIYFLYRRFEVYIA
jgi:hypothetical protein